MTSFRQLRQQRHGAWLAELKRQLGEVLEAGPERRPEQIYLFGSRRGVIGMGCRIPIYWWWELANPMRNFG